MSVILLKIAGKEHGGWTSATINLSMENLCGAFQLIVTNKWPGQTFALDIKIGDACEVYIDNDIVLTGYVDKVNPLIDANNHIITVEGRDKAGDLVDCSILGTHEWKNQKIEKIVQDICLPFGIPVITKVDTGLKLPTFNAEQTMTAFEAIKKVCSKRNCLAYSDGRGGLIINRAGTEKVATSIVEGVNFKSGSAEYDGTERFSQYICKGQRQGDDNSTADGITGAKAIAYDETITRYRPLIICAEGDATIADCQVRVNWEATVRKGKSRKYTTMVNGWRMQNGDLWPLNNLVTLKSDSLKTGDSLLIAGINFKMDEGGEMSEMALIPADAYAVLPDNKIKKGKGGKGGGGGNQFMPDVATGTTGE